MDFPRLALLQLRFLDWVVRLALDRHLGLLLEPGLRPDLVDGSEWVLCLSSVEEALLLAGYGASIK